MNAWQVFSVKYRALRDSEHSELPRLCLNFGPVPGINGNGGRKNEQVTSFPLSGVSDKSAVQFGIS